MLVWRCAYLCAYLNVCGSLSSRLTPSFCQYQVGQTRHEQKTTASKGAAGKTVCVRVWMRTCLCVWFMTGGQNDFLFFSIFSVNEREFEQALAALVPHRPLFSAVSTQCHENIGMMGAEYISSVVSWRLWDTDFILRGKHDSVFL